jgi:hypothetical protein
MLIRSARKSDYTAIIETDKKIYPTADPITADTLGQWYKNNPEFGIIFEQDDRLKGMCISIPLTSEAWQKLISGKLSESELRGSAIFQASADNEIGIHVYHLEKKSEYPKAFYRNALIALGAVTHDLRRKNSALRIIGFSALGASPEGISLFEKKLNFREREFVNKEYVLRKAGRTEIFRPQSEEGLEVKLADGYECINRCKMLVLYPTEPSIVWNFLN